METAIVKPKVVNGKLKLTIQKGSRKKIKCFKDIDGANEIVSKINIQAYYIQKSQDFEKGSLNKVFSKNCLIN